MEDRKTELSYSRYHFAIYIIHTYTRTYFIRIPWTTDAAETNVYKRSLTNVWLWLHHQIRPSKCFEFQGKLAIPLKMRTFVSGSSVSDFS